MRYIFIFILGLLKMIWFVPRLAFTIVFFILCLPFGLVGMVLEYGKTNSAKPMFDLMDSCSDWLADRYITFYIDLELPLV